MRRSLLSTLLATSLLLTAGANAQTSNPASLAKQALDQLDAGNYAQVEALFSPEMAAAVPANKLKSVWESLHAQAGKATGRGDADITTQGETSVIKIPLHYEKAEVIATFAMDREGKIIGFLVQPAQTKAPEIASDATYVEHDVVVGSGERALPGTLSMPKGDGSFPAVVLVHGSGPQDRDETIGPNKPFLDIARSLAAQGIAVLRYDKRTKARPQDFADGDFGVDEETTNDAVLAVDALRKMDGIDNKRIFVLGHSQGGMMTPRIAAVSGHVAGLILLAAPSRSLLDIVIEQNRRLAMLNDGTIDEIERSTINTLIEQVRLTRDSKTPTSSKTVMGLSAGYWRSMDAVDPVAEAKQVNLPMLVLQGARDIQVVDADWQNWKNGFHDAPNVSFNLYEKLNHLGIAGEGEGSLAEYAQPGHVDASLINDVASWIKAH